MKRRFIIKPAAEQDLLDISSLIARQSRDFPHVRFALTMVALILPAMAWFIWTFWHSMQQRWQQPGCCPSCGYDLRGSADRCPECGTVPITEVG